jgi:hypothetical protein
VSEDVYAAVLGMVLASTIVSPYLIRAVFSRRGEHPEKSDAEDGATAA